MTFPPVYGLAALLLLNSFSWGEAAEPLPTGANDSAEPASQEKKDPLAEPLTSLELQLKLLVAGDVEGLRRCFTERQRPNVTKYNVTLARSEASHTVFANLIAKIDYAEHAGQKTAQVRATNGRTITTLVLTNGQWLSDSIWYR